MPVPDAINGFDAAIASWFAGHATPLGSLVGRWISRAGAPPVMAALALVAALVAALRRRRLEALVWVLAVGGGIGINEAVKRLVQRPRPVTGQDFVPLTYSFPSGHAMTSLIAFALLAYLGARARPDRRFAIISGSALIVLAIGLSRLSLGLHYATDVLGGWIIGALWLALCLALLVAGEKKRARYQVPPLIGRTTPPPAVGP